MVLRHLSCRNKRVMTDLSPHHSAPSSLRYLLGLCAAIGHSILGILQSLGKITAFAGQVFGHLFLPPLFLRHVFKQFLDIGYYSQMHEELLVDKTIYENFESHGLAYSRERLASIL